jgi:hypothetical protein
MAAAAWPGAADAGVTSLAGNDMLQPVRQALKQAISDSKPTWTIHPTSSCLILLLSSLSPAPPARPLRSLRSRSFTHTSSTHSLRPFHQFKLPLAFFKRKPTRPGKAHEAGQRLSRKTVPVRSSFGTQDAAADERQDGVLQLCSASHSHGSLRR